MLFYTLAAFMLGVGFQALTQPGLPLDKALWLLLFFVYSANIGIDLGRWAIKRTMEEKIIQRLR